MDNYLLSANYYFLTSILDRVILSKLILVILYCFIYSLDYITSIVTNKLILKYNEKKSINSIFIVKTNWFLLHAVCNFIMCSASVPDIITTFKNPSRSLDYTINYSMIPIFMSLSLHLYHIINKKINQVLVLEIMLSLCLDSKIYLLRKVVNYGKVDMGTLLYFSIELLKKS